MIEKISRFLAVQMATALNEKENVNIFNYGLQIILNTFLSITLVITVGSCIGQPMHTLFYLFCYCSIRLWAGGYHASSNAKCIFLFLLFFVVSIISAEIIVFDKTILFLGLILENIILFLTAPVGTPKNPIPTLQIEKMKRKVVLSSFIVNSLIMLQSDMKMKVFGFFGFSWVVILVLYGKIFGEDNLYEK